MYIEAVPNRNSPPAILLRESYREGGKVRKRTLCNLSDWPTAYIEGLRGVLKGGTVIPVERDAFTIIRSLPHGHAAAALGTARKIGLDRILGPGSDRCRDLILALLVGRILDPASKLATARALSPATAASSLGELLGLGEVDEDELYNALDWLLERQPAIEATLANAISPTARWCCTMCHRATWKAAAARSPNVATAATAGKVRCRLSTVCSALRMAALLPSRCSRATPPIR
jgi:hypothetical protein